MGSYSPTSTRAGRNMVLFVVIVVIFSKPEKVWSHISCTMDQAKVKYNYRRDVCTPDHVKEAIKSNKICSPRPVIVQLPWPNNTNVQQMSPQHISLLQCEGGCHRSHHGCVATETRVRRVPVMLGKCGIGRGKCDKECAEVEVEEHTECECSCLLSENMCESDLHEYNRDKCACECRDILGKRECLNQGKIWNEDTCKCGCPAVFSCSLGSVYSNITCSCEVVENQISDVEDNRIPRSNDTVNITWEVVIIGILSGIIIILTMIICLLVERLRRLQNLHSIKISQQNNKEESKVHLSVDSHSRNEEKLYTD